MYMVIKIISEVHGQMPAFSNKFRLPLKPLSLRSIYRPGREIRQLVGSRKPTLVEVRKLMIKIHGFLSPAKNRAEYVRFFHARPETLVGRKRIPVVFENGKPAFGCYQESRILAESLHLMGVRATITSKFIPEKGNPQSLIPHNTVVFELNGNIYEAETLFGQKIKRLKRQ